MASHSTARRDREPADSCPAPFVASGGLLVGEGLPVIGKLLGHSKVQPTDRYAHPANDPLKATANRIASRIAEIAGQPRR